MSIYKTEQDWRKALEKLLGFSPFSFSYYVSAFTHASFKGRKEGVHEDFPHFRRLEFLGDAVLGSIVSDFVVRSCKEAKATEFRRNIVNNKNLFTISKELKLFDFLDYSGNNKLGDKIYADLVESLIGAIYLDRGYGFAYFWVEKKLNLKSYIPKDNQKTKESISYEQKFFEILESEGIKSGDIKYDDKCKKSMREGCHQATISIEGKDFATVYSENKEELKEKAYEKAYKKRVNP